MQWAEASEAMDGSERSNGWKRVIQWTEVAVLAQMLLFCDILCSFPGNSAEDTIKIYANLFCIVISYLYLCNRIVIC